MTWSDAFDAAEALLEPASAERAATLGCCLVSVAQAEAAVTGVSA